MTETKSAHDLVKEAACEWCAAGVFVCDYDKCSWNKHPKLGPHHHHLNETQRAGIHGTHQSCPALSLAEFAEQQAALVESQSARLYCIDAMLGSFDHSESDVEHIEDRLKRLLDSYSARNVERNALHESVMPLIEKTDQQEARIKELEAQSIDETALSNHLQAVEEHNDLLTARLAALTSAITRAMEATGIVRQNPSGDLADDFANVMQAFISEAGNDKAALKALEADKARRAVRIVELTERLAEQVARVERNAAVMETWQKSAESFSSDAECLDWLETNRKEINMIEDRDGTWALCWDPPDTKPDAMGKTLRETVRAAMEEKP